MRLALAAATAALLAAAFAAPAGATPVLVLDGNHATWHEDRYLPATDLPPAAGGPARVTAARARSRRRRKPAKPATLKALARLVTQGAIGAPEYYADVATYKRAVSADKRLGGTRRAELAAVIANADAMAAHGTLTRDRLPAVLMTLDRNTQWWTNGPIPGASTRVGFSGSQLVWEYYPGQGIELQALGNFGKANGLWQANANTKLRSLLAELLPLAVDRGGATTWEYYFRFDGGAPPWTSAISQGTAVQALAHASQRLGDPSYAAVGRSALALFSLPPPLGVRVDEPAGPFYVIYSFDPRGLVLNAFLQAVIGLHDFAQITGDPTAASLYAAGDAEALAAVPAYDTGAWSLYQPGQEDTLDYHNLVTSFLKRLCGYTNAPVYCDTASRFKSYLHTPPTVTPVTTRVRAGRPALLAFQLDKVSHVAVEVLRGGTVLFETGAQLGRGTHRFLWRAPKQGSYTVQLVAVDLAGNRAEASGPLTVLPARRRRRHKH